MSTPPDHTTLAHLAATLATSAGAARALSDPLAVAERIHNANGHKYPVRGDFKRASRAVVTIRGCEIAVEYFTDGYYLPATDIDDACFPSCDIKSIEIGNQDATRFLDDTSLAEEIREAVERSWQE